MENKFGKTSKLCITASYKGDKTILSDVSFTAPFKIMRPLYIRPMKELPQSTPAAQDTPGVGQRILGKDSAVDAAANTETACQETAAGTAPNPKNKRFMTVMILTASAGIMAGDRQEFSIRAQENTALEVVSQAYEKVHAMDNAHAERKTEITVAPHACLYYTPLPTIPFADSDFRSRMDVHLADETSRFVFREVLTCGRLAHGEEFGYRRFQNLINISRGGTLIYRDNTLYEPEWMNMRGFGMYEGFSHLANLILCNEPRDDAWMLTVRSMLDENGQMEGGVTRMASGDIVVRILGRTGDQLTKMMDRILDL